MGPLLEHFDGWQKHRQSKSIWIYRVWRLKCHSCLSNMAAHMDGMQSGPCDAVYAWPNSLDTSITFITAPVTVISLDVDILRFCNKLTPILMLQEKERLAAMEKRYHSLTGGKSFPKSSSAMREVRALNLLACLQQALTGSSSNRRWCVAADNLRSDCSTRAAIIETNLKINGCCLFVIEFLLMSRLISQRSLQ